MGTLGVYTVLVPWKMIIPTSSQFDQDPPIKASRGEMKAIWKPSDLKITAPYLSHEKKNRGPVFFPLKYWLFNRDPYNGLLESAHNWVGPFFIAQLFNGTVVGRHPAPVEVGSLRLAYAMVYMFCYGCFTSQVVGRIYEPSTVSSWKTEENFRIKAI